MKQVRLPVWVKNGPDRIEVTSGLPRSTDIVSPAGLVRFVPLPDSCTASKQTPFDLSISGLTWPLWRGRV